MKKSTITRAIVNAKRKELKTSLQRVEHLLEEIPEARGSDKILRALYLAVYHSKELREWKLDHHTPWRRTEHQWVGQMLYDLFQIGPSYETLRRSRQRVQEERPELKAADEQTRLALEEAHRKFFSPIGREG